MHDLTPAAMQIELVYARTGDCDLILDFMAAYYQLDGIPFVREKAAAALAELLADPSAGRVWLITAESDAVGYVVLTFGFSLEYHGRDAFIDELYVDGSFRGRGYGRRALALVEDEARALHVRELHLEVERRNEGAQRLYRRLGFSDHDRYLMSKRLS